MNEYEPSLYEEDYFIPFYDEQDDIQIFKDSRDDD